MRRFALPLAALAVLSLVLSGPLTRFGLMPWQVGLGLFALAGLLGLAAVVLGALRRQRVAIVLGALAAAMPVYGLVQALSAPRINEASGQTMLKEAPPGAFARANKAAQEMGWEIVRSDPVRGQLDAVATSFWFGFKDDVEVRVSDAGAGSQVAARSKSRVGKGDAGANAKRIRTYSQRLM
jgi:hypothetical protein